jgi:alpha-amylase/alpha-mannosidase (GH57 family)
MRALSEYKDEECLDILAEILDPINKIAKDKSVKKAYESDDTLKLAKAIIKRHKPEVVKILATLDNKKVEDYHYNFITLMQDVINIIHDEVLLDFFRSVQMIGTPIISTMPTTTAQEEPTLKDS